MAIAVLQKNTAIFVLLLAFFFLPLLQRCTYFEVMCLSHFCWWPNESVFFFFAILKTEINQGNKNTTTFVFFFSLCCEMCAALSHCQSFTVSATVLREEIIDVLLIKKLFVQTEQMLVCNTQTNFDVSFNFPLNQCRNFYFYRHFASHRTTEFSCVILFTLFARVCDCVCILSHTNPFDFFFQYSIDSST